MTTEDSLTIIYILVAPEVDADRLGSAPPPTVPLAAEGVDAEEVDLHLKLLCFAIEC